MEEAWKKRGFLKFRKKHGNNKTLRLRHDLDFRSEYVPDNMN